MNLKPTRREFLATTGATAAAAAMGVNAAAQEPAVEEKTVKRKYDISLAAWSLHKSIGKEEGKFPMLEMPKLARQEFDIGAIELVSGMMADSEKPYLDELAKNAADNNVKILLIMIDGQGDIGTEREETRNRAVGNHKKWIDIAHGFGCHSVRMNWRGHAKDVMNNPEEMTAFIERSVPGLRALCDYGDSKGLNVIIENHGGPSSYPDALERLIKAVDHPRFGTLPDFGNFPEDVDRYDAVDRLMPYAKAVSAKCYDFDHVTGQETKMDFERLISIVHDKHGYHGYIGIEYEGTRMSEFDGIKACRDLLLQLKGA